jgi:hypothetical protein
MGENLNISVAVVDSVDIPQKIIAACIQHLAANNLRRNDEAKD